MTTDHVVVPTAHASRYLQQLCKHWAHKFDTEFTPETGRVALPLGEVALGADAEALRVDLRVANDADRAQMRDVVQRHIERFAFREILEFRWQTASDAEPSRG